MAYRDDVTAEYVRSRLDYDPETGVFVWKPITDLSAARFMVRWNNRYAGKVAGVTRRDGYRGISFNCRTAYLAHRLAWLMTTGSFPATGIDHINRNRADNRLVNLREATQAENLRNLPLFNTNKTGYKGVSVRKGVKNPTWRAHIVFNNKQICLGSFSTPEEAAAAYQRASAKYHREFGSF